MLTSYYAYNMYIILDEEGFLATAHICDVEKHISVGFGVDEIMTGSRHAYIVVYFSHGGTWSGIEKSECS